MAQTLVRVQNSHGAHIYRKIMVSTQMLGLCNLVYFIYVFPLSYRSTLYLLDSLNNQLFISKIQNAVTSPKTKLHPTSEL